MKAMMMQTRSDREARGQRLEAKTGGGARTEIWTGVFLVSGLWLLASGAKAQDGQTLLSQMKAAESRISYSAMLSRDGESQRIYRSGDKRRIEWLAPPLRKGDFQLDDGANVYIYHRADNSVTKTNSRERTYSYVATGNATATNFAGRRVFSVPVTGNRTVFVDAATKALIGMRGNNSGFALNQIHFGAVPAAKFQFSAPVGASVTSFPGALYLNLNAARRDVPWLQSPTQLPTGWKLESAVAGSTSAWLRYSNGQSRISLFEQRTTDPDYKPKAVDGGTFWRKAGVRFLATGSPQSIIDQVVTALK